MQWNIAIFKFRTALVLLLAVLGASAFPAAAENVQVTHVNSIGMRFALIPAGEFMMGNAESSDTLAAAFSQYERKRVEEIDSSQRNSFIHDPRFYTLWVELGRF